MRKPTWMKGRGGARTLLLKLLGITALTELKQSAFFRHTVTLMSGTMIAQAIPLLTAPILTRQYTPRDFGIFAIFGAVTTIVGTVANGRYEMAILLPKEHREGRTVLILSLIVPLLVGLLAALLCTIFTPWVVGLLGVPASTPWVWWIPPTICMLGWNQALSAWANRRLRYHFMAWSRILQAISTAGVKILLGCISAGAVGLLGGYLCGLTLSLGVLTIALLRSPLPPSELPVPEGGGWSALLTAAKRYKNFPLYMIPGSFMNVAAGQLPNILIGHLFGLSSAGFYALAQRAITLPVSVLTNSISEVFRQKASADYAATGNLGTIYRRVLRLLLLISPLVFLPLALVAQPLFGLVFGEVWRPAGELVTILCIVFAVQVVASPLSTTFIVPERQRFNLAWQTGLFAVSVSSIYFGWFVAPTFQGAMVYYAIGSAAMYLVNLVYSRAMACASTP